MPLACNGTLRLSGTRGRGGHRHAAALVIMSSVYAVERRLKIDDPVGAVSVRVAAGLWGVLAVGPLADGT